MLKLDLSTSPPSVSTNHAPSQNDPTPEENALKTAIRKRTTGIESGKYRSNTKHILEEFHTWLQSNRDVTTFTELIPTDCRRYTQHLRDRARNDNQNLSASSARMVIDFSLDSKRMLSLTT